ncbi:hypothetical protein FOL47_002897 [Perkinsus chesapeaki]|uniref:Uncharacterized protein n=1 Tax=Perkinsus chesapeaki TaxID=330153 RepID=A0A7J6MAU2_PERCH|nr:hypothetical protein FOL47_002897 [Perkinsus chesapeaki]
MPRLFIYLALMISVAIAQGTNRSLQPTVRPTGSYVSQDHAVNGVLHFPSASSSTLFIGIVVQDCFIDVRAIPYEIIHVEGSSHMIFLAYSGTALKIYVEQCQDPNIVVEDFAQLKFTFQPGGANLIDLVSSKGLWHGTFYHVD